MTVLVLIVVLALVGSGVAVAVFTGSNTTTARPNPKSTATSPAASHALAAALAAARRAQSFHYVVTSSLTGPQASTQRTVGDAGPTSGRQVITDGKQRFTVLVVGTACFIEGNAAALTANLGLSSTDAAANAGKWISLARTDGPYASVYAAVTAPSAIADNITVVPQNLSAPTRLAGRRVQSVSGSIARVTIAGQSIAPKGTAALAVRAGTNPLPVRYTERDAQNGGQGTTRLSFSRWGVPVTETAPSGAVAFATIAGPSGTVPSSPNGTFLT
jgi:hypothetical protein